MQLDEYYNLTVDQFRHYRDSHQEKDYVLVDVRLPEEYEDEHIPGCLLIPLGELAHRLTELPADRDIIFYCNSGRRSRAASLFATSIPFFQKKVYNVPGGILAYHGRTLPDYPVLAAFDLNSSTEELLLAAMNLERGTSEFYSSLLEKTGDSVIRATIDKLARAESSHARLLYNHWKKEKKGSVPSFTEIYDSLQGDVVEGGRKLDELLDDLDELHQYSHQVALEVILDIEFTAYDLYRAAAEKLRGSGIEDTFLHLAQAEKHHMQLAAASYGERPLKK